MKRLFVPLIALGLMSPLGIAQAEPYTSYSYNDLYAKPHHSGYNDYIKMSMGTYTSDLDKKAATIGFGWQRSLPSGFGYGVNVNHSLSSSITEGDSGDMDLRYLSVAPYLNGEIGLFQLDSMSRVKAFARVGASIIKPEGTYADAIYDDIEYGAYYGAGVSIPFAHYGDFEVGVSVQDPIDVVEFQGAVRFLF